MEKFPNHNKFNSEQDDTRNINRERGRFISSILGDPNLNVYNHQENSSPSELEVKVTKYIDKHYGELNPNDLDKRIENIKSSEPGPEQDYYIAKSLFYPEKIKESHPEVLSERDVHKILMTGYEIDESAAEDNEFNHIHFVFTNGGDYAGGVDHDSAKDNLVRWEKNNIICSLSKEESPLSSVDQGIILQMMKERSYEYMAGDHDDWYENIFPDVHYDEISYYADDMRTLAKIFNGKSMRTTIVEDFTKVMRHTDHESFRADKGWEGYSFSEIIGRASLNMDDFSHTIDYMKHKVKLIQDLEKRIRYYEIYRNAVESGKQALGL